VCFQLFFYSSWIFVLEFCVRVVFLNLTIASLFKIFHDRSLRCLIDDSSVFSDVEVAKIDSTTFKVSERINIVYNFLVTDLKRVNRWWTESDSSSLLSSLSAQSVSIAHFQSQFISYLHCCKEFYSSSRRKFFSRSIIFYTLWIACSADWSLLVFYS